MNIRAKAEQLNSHIIGWRRDLHQMPEVGLQCPNTAKYICERLEEMGIPYQTFDNHSGVIGLIGKKSGKTVGLRADMDGLNVAEKNNFEYASNNNNMHACGHDAHTATLLGAARILKDMEDELDGQVKLIFQPDEESLTGARQMIEDGVLENPSLDCMYLMHVGSIGGKGNEIGDIIVGKKAVFASSDAFNIVITGKGGHASTPHLTIDPIIIAARFIENLQSLISRETKTGIPAVISITSLIAGQGTYNIIPDTAEIRGGFRTGDLTTRDYLMCRIREVLEHTATMMGASAELNMLAGCPSTINDLAITERFLNSAGKILPAEKILEMKETNMGGEDAAYFLAQVPGCYFFLYNACPSDDGVEYPHHNARFCIDDSVLYLGSALFAQAAVDYLDSSKTSTAQ